MLELRPRPRRGRRAAVGDGALQDAADLFRLLRHDNEPEAGGVTRGSEGLATAGCRQREDALTIEERDDRMRINPRVHELLERFAPPLEGATWAGPGRCDECSDEHASRQWPSSLRDLRLMFGASHSGARDSRGRLRDRRTWSAIVTESPAVLKLLVAQLVDALARRELVGDPGRMIPAESSTWKYDRLARVATKLELAPAPKPPAADCSRRRPW
jgi:hypothetical protein